MLPQTQFEIDGSWTSVVDGDTFLQTVASETGVPIDSIGQSVEGREIYRLILGSGQNTILITSGVHGTERANREAILARARDLAYNESSQYTNFLTNNKVVIIPTMNPDRMHRLYRNAEDIDINRVTYPLDSPEGRAFMTILMDIDPDMFVDFHERGGNNADDVEFVRAMHLDPNADINVRDTIQQALDYLIPNLENSGYTAGYYPSSAVGFGSLTSGAGILGYPTFTSETWTRNDPQDRVSAQMKVFDLVLNWYENNLTLLKQTKNSFADNMLKPKDTFVLLNDLLDGEEYYQRATQVPIIIPEGYQLNIPSEFDSWKDIYNIQVNPDGFVPSEQSPGRMIPHLLDPQSDWAVVDATRVEPKEPERRTDGRYTKVLYGEWTEVFIKNYFER